MITLCNTDIIKTVILGLESLDFLQKNLQRFLTRGSPCDSRSTGLRFACPWMATSGEMAIYDREIC